MAQRPGMQLQWSLEQTVTSTLSVARGVIEAATNDNIQALALLACERFGATLAMCPETCRKVEDLVIKTKTPAVISFLSAVVGYSPTDCASELVRSLAGVQFLGLATSLVTTIGAFQGGNALEAMLTSSAADKTLLPTARQLKDLLASLEHRCVRSGFADSVLGYHILLTTSLNLSGIQAHGLWRGCAQYPEAVGIAMLVDAFRQLSRIGDAQQVTIRTTACAPWIVAFTKWCLGHPPSIYFEDGHPLLEQSAVGVTVIVSRDIGDHSEIEIAVYREVDTPAELITARGMAEPYCGMVNIENYGRWLCRDYELASNIGFRAIQQALPYALKQIITHMQFSYTLADTKQTSQPQTSSSSTFRARSSKEEDLMGLATSPFAPDSVISEMTVRLLGLPHPLPLQPLPEGLLVGNLPLVELYIRDLKEACSCAKCSDSQSQHFLNCSVSGFFKSLAHLIADIITLSLFDNSESLLVYMNHKTPDRLLEATFATTVSGTDHPILAYIALILHGGQIQTANNADLLDWALSLIGHDVHDDLRKGGWTISAFRGQVAFPKLYETQTLKKRGFLTLSWAPGLLLHNSTVYTRGLFGGINPSTKALPLAGPHRDVTEPVNLVPRLGLVWRVTPRDNYLKVDLSLDSPGSNLSFISTSAFMILNNMASALVLETCPHDPNAFLPGQDLFCEYSGPVIPSKFGLTKSIGLKVDDARLQVVAVAGNSGLRMFTLSSAGFGAVLRGNACLSCCLDVCRRFDYTVIIC